MADTKDSIQLDITAQAHLDALDKVVSELKKLETQVQKTSDKQSELGKSIDLSNASGEIGQMVGKVAGLAAAIGTAVAGALALANGYRNMVAEGIKYNANLGDAEVAIGNVLKKFDNLDEIASKQEAAKAIEQIKKVEPQAAATLDQLIEGFLATLAASKSAGVSVEENVDLVGRFSNALANANLPAQQLAQEMRSIVSGNIGADSSLAKILEISNADIAKAKEAGDLYGFLVDKLGSLGEAGDTAGVRLSTLQSQLDAIKGQVAQPAFDLWKDSLVALQETLAGNPVLVESLTEVTRLLADAVKITAEFAGAITGLNFGRAVEQAKRLSDQFDAQRDSLREQLSAADKSAEKLEVRVKLQDEEAKLVAQLKDADGLRRDILENQLNWVQLQLDNFDKVAGKVSAAKVEDEKRTKELQKQKELTDKQIEAIQKIQAQLDKTALGNLDPKDQVKQLEGDVLAAASRIRDMFREAGLEIPGLDATAADMAKLAEQAQGQTKAALFEAIGAFDKLSESEDKAQAAAKKTAEADKKAAEEAQKRAKEVRNLADSLQDQLKTEKERVDAQLQALTSKDDFGSARDQVERNKLIERQAQLRKQEEDLKKQLPRELQTPQTEAQKFDQAFSEGLTDLLKKISETKPAATPEAPAAPTSPTTPPVTPPATTTPVPPATTPLQPAAPATTPTTAPTTTGQIADLSGVQGSMDGLEASVQALTDAVKTGLDGVAVKVTEVAAPIQDSITALADTLAKMQEGVTEAITKLGEGITAYNTTVADGLTALTTAVTAADADLARRITQLEAQIKQKR